PSLLLKNYKADFRGRITQNKKNAFGFGPTGFVFGMPDRYNKKNSNAISLAITQTANFNNRINYTGLNNYSSFSEQFAEEFAKSGYTIDQVLNTNSPFPYSSAPALYAYLIDTIKVNGVYQVKGAPEFILDAGQAIKQEMIKDTKGGIYEAALGFAHNDNDKWYYGGTLSIPIINYTSSTTFKESDTSANSNNHFNNFIYQDNFTTKGLGFSGKAGIIFRPKEYIRFGLAVHTPTLMTLNDTRTVLISTSLENPIKNFTGSSQTFTNSVPGISKYFQTNAYRVIGSASYVFREIENVKKQRAFITADIEYVNHRGSRFSSNNQSPTDVEKAYYKELNGVVKSLYKGTFNFKTGGELKFNTVMARLGFAYYGNPYKDVPYKANRMLFSGGLGYRNKGVFIDLTYVYTMAKDADLPYRLQDRANTYASTKPNQGNIAVTLGFKF
ncbi:MAG: hypothetical protein WCG67_09490, partial [Ferruginibacter sp.]